MLMNINNVTIDDRSDLKDKVILEGWRDITIIPLQSFKQQMTCINIL